MKGVRHVRSSRVFTTCSLGPACLLVLAGCAAGPKYVDVPIRSLPLATGYRIIAPASRAESSPAELLQRVARADVVFIGEEHDDPETHRAEAELLDAFGQLGRPIVLSLEMFERDVQPALDDYLAGRINEPDFLARSRPWDRYATDYRPLVEMAKRHHWPVIASNVPRPLASAIGRKGLAALDTLVPRERAMAARQVTCPSDDYRARFMESMRSHSPGSGPAPRAGDSLPSAMAERFYLAQCVKDETMAESVVRARRAMKADALLVHVDGSFHSDYGQGTVARVRRREPSWDVVVVTAVPVPDPATAPMATQAGRAEFVVFTRRAKQPD
ncbi:MAG: ChaN family lipoprotein [bacterium]